MKCSSPMLLVRLTQHQLAVVLSIVFAILAVPRCAAQVRGTVEVSPLVGPYRYKQSYGCFFGCMTINGEPVEPCGCAPPGWKTTAVLGGRVTGWLSRSTALEGTLLCSPSSAVDNPVIGSARGLVRFAPHARLWAYAVGGPALVRFSDGVSGGHTFHMGGVPSLGFRAEVERYLYSTEESQVHNTLFATFALSAAVRAGTWGPP